MKKYHVATGDGKSYYGIGYESYRQAESLLKISQMHDREAHIVEEEYHITNADRIRAMSDEELAKFLAERFANETCNRLGEDNLVTATQITAITHTWYCCWMDWLRRPAEGSQ